MNKSSSKFEDYFDSHIPEDGEYLDIIAYLWGLNVQLNKLQELQRSDFTCRPIKEWEVKNKKIDECYEVLEKLLIRVGNVEGGIRKHLHVTDSYNQDLIELDREIYEDDEIGGIVK